MQFGEKGDGGDQQRIVGQRRKKLRGHDGVKTLLHAFDFVSIADFRHAGQGGTGWGGYGLQGTLRRGRVELSRLHCAAASCGLPDSH
ncbi:hypothetical protein D9M72_586460 [compost metagenome]